jgi:hypothetical protein
MTFNLESTMSDKILVTSRSALVEKYGKKGGRPMERREFIAIIGGAAVGSARRRGNRMERMLFGRIVAS